ncbi:MAG: hypothetical protein WCP11_02690 [Candidatus Saccharibacteria bacterium]
MREKEKKMEQYKGIADALCDFAKRLGKEYGIEEIPREDVCYCFMYDLETIDSAYMTRKIFGPSDRPESITLNSRAQKLLKEECAKRKDFTKIWGLTHLMHLLQNEDNLQILNDELLKSATEKNHFDMIMEFAPVNSPTWLEAMKGRRAITD